MTRSGKGVRPSYHSAVDLKIILFQDNLWWQCEAVRESGCLILTLPDLTGCATLGKSFLFPGLISPSLKTFFFFFYKRKQEIPEVELDRRFSSTLVIPVSFLEMKIQGSRLTYSIRTSETESSTLQDDPNVPSSLRTIRLDDLYDPSSSVTLRTLCFLSSTASNSSQFCHSDFDLA